MQGRLFYFVCFLQEVITNEHVVAMMKAAISETEDIPLFVSKKTYFFQFLFIHMMIPLPVYLLGLCHDVVGGE